MTTLSDQITVTEIKEEDYVEDTADGCQPETLSTEGTMVHECSHAGVDTADLAALHIY